jgi:hypothetical protein
MGYMVRSSYSAFDRYPVHVWSSAILAVLLMVQLLFLSYAPYLQFVTKKKERKNVVFKFKHESKT